MHAVVIAYMLTVATLIPASGWLADRFGTKRIFLVSIIIDLPDDQAATACSRR